MAITRQSQGAGVATETSGAALSPLCPAVVAANHILVAHVYFEGTTSTPSTPSGWTLLSGPHVIETTIARMWVFGRLADGSEDGAAVAFGSQAVTTMRAARIYSFAGYVSGTITDVIPAASFAFLSHATDPQMPTVTTTVAGARAVALIGQNDNNSLVSATGESGGDWVEDLGEFLAALTPGLVLGSQTAVPTADPGTITGGTIATTNDPCGVIGFEIRPNGLAVNYELDCQPGSFAVTGAAAGLLAARAINAAPGSYAVTGVAATLVKGYNLDAQPGSYAVTGSSATLLADRLINAQPGTYSVTGAEARFDIGMQAAPGSLAVTGAPAALLADRLLSASPGSFAITGFQALTIRELTLNAQPGVFVITGFDVSGDGWSVSYELNAEPGAFTVTGAPAALLADRVLSASPGSFSVSGAAASLVADRVLNAQPGVFVITGIDATFVEGGGFIPTGKVPAVGPIVMIQTNAPIINMAGRTAIIRLPVTADIAQLETDGTIVVVSPEGDVWRL